MIEDEILKLRFKLGGEDALRRMYEKYLDYLLGVAMAFLNNSHVEFVEPTRFAKHGLSSVPGR